MTRHVGVRLGAVQRSKGQSAVQRSRYQLQRTHPRRDDETLVFHLLSVPHPVGDQRPDPEEFWQTLEDAERRRNATTARSLDFPIPRELPSVAHETLARRLAAGFVSWGLPVQVDVHSKTALDGKANPHVHLMVATRCFTEEGWAARKHRGLERFFRERRGKLVSERVAARLNEFGEFYGVGPVVHTASNMELGLPAGEQRRPPGIFREPNRRSSASALADLRVLRHVRANRRLFEPQLFHRLRDEIDALEWELLIDEQKIERSLSASATTTRTSQDALEHGEPDWGAVMDLDPSLNPDPEDALEQLLHEDDPFQEEPDWDAESNEPEPDENPSEQDVDDDPDAFDGSEPPQ